MILKPFKREACLPLPIAFISTISADGIRNNRGMKYCTAREIGKFEPFGAMFPDGKDPLAEKYRE